MTARLSVSVQGDPRLQVGTGGATRLSLSEAAAGGTTDYGVLHNKPRIEGRELVGDKTFGQLGLEPMTLQEIDDMLYG